MANLISPTSEIWFRPIAGGQIVRPFRAPETPYGPGHRGIDISAAMNNPVLSPTDGTISFIGKVGYRNLVTVETPQGFMTMEPVCSEMLVGEPIQAGSEIGSVCLPDPEYVWHCGECLHLGLRTESGYLSPELYLGGLTPSRLLP